MQLLSLTCLAGALLLSGCATTLGTGNSPSYSTDNAWETTPYSALVPDKTLEPITPSKAGNGKVTSLFTPADLWDRIRRGFAMPNLQHDLVQDREQWYAQRPDYMLRMTERSSKYLFHIVEELERRGMPTELALLPYIESAFNPQAVSSAKAAGMWQFMPATGTYFDLKQNVFRDDRRDVLASTRAALDYLQKLHGMFGDWHLALAAYNWGEGSVGRAIAKNQKAGLGIRYTDLNMPAETRMYVPKLQAVKNIVANPDAFRTELPLIENHPYFQTVDITHDIDVALVARLSGVREADFRALNPSFNKPVILAAGTPQILLPWDNAKVFERNLQAHNQGQYASWTVWTVPNTMNVAEAAQRAGMSETDLRALNNIPPRMLIKAGSALMVPRSTTMREDVTEHVADNGHMALTPEIVTRRTVVRAKKRDTVITLAQRYRVSPASVADWNDIKPKAAFKPGQEVVLFLPVQIKTHMASRDTAKKAAPTTRIATKTDSKKALASKPRSVTTAQAKKKEPVRKVAQADSPAKVRRH
ncbi:MAG: transglycosylase SLT domain-containing protein [Burkholderiaceae bacterium]|nr:transglycosylase SLT domain-containing protein [Burkholderiaceae bacterium]